MEQMMRLLHHCGLPVEDVDFINSDGKTMNKILLEVFVLEFMSIVSTGLVKLIQCVYFVTFFRQIQEWPSSQVVLE